MKTMKYMVLAAMIAATSSAASALGTDPDPKPKNPAKLCEEAYDKDIKGCGTEYREGVEDCRKDYGKRPTPPLLQCVREAQKVKTECIKDAQKRKAKCLLKGNMTVETAKDVVVGDVLMLR